MPSALLPARALRALLRTPATINTDTDALCRGVSNLSAAIIARIAAQQPPDEDLPLLLQEMVELGPQLEALGAAMAAELPHLKPGMRAALLEQQHSALYLLSALWPLNCAPSQPPYLLLPAFTSLARGTGAMLAASAATLSAPQHPDEDPTEVLGCLSLAAPALVQQVARVAELCQEVDACAFCQPVASQLLAALALNDSTGLSFVAAVLAAFHACGGGGSSPAVDLSTACMLTDLLAMPAAAELRRALRADSQLQSQLLQLLLPALVSPVAGEHQRTLEPISLPTCVGLLLEVAPDAITAHMAAPAGLRSLQAARQTLEQLQQEAHEQQREKRRQQRRAAAGQQASEEEQSQAAQDRTDANSCSEAVHTLARVQLFAALADTALQAPGSTSERAVVIHRLLEDTLPAVTALLQHSAAVLPQASWLWPEAWSLAGQTFGALWQVLSAAVHGPAAPISQRGFDSAIAALLAALQLRALLCGLQKDWRTWQQQQLQQLQEGVLATLLHLQAGAWAAESYISVQASQVCHIATQQSGQMLQIAQREQQCVGDVAADISRKLAALVPAHASFASLLQLLNAEEDISTWDLVGVRGGLPAALHSLGLAAQLLFTALRIPGPPSAAECGKIDAIVLTHFAAVRLADQAPAGWFGALGKWALRLDCNDYCMPVAAAAGAAAILESLKERQCQAQQGEEDEAAEPPLLAALRAEERRQAEAGPAERTALALRVERAKALRPCASLACPHLAANPGLRGKVCSSCRTLRYCCAEDQAQDWKAGGHRAACRLLRDAGGEGSGSM